MSQTASGSDLITGSMTHLATAASKQKKAVIVGVVVLLAATLAGSLYLSKRNAFRTQASEALFKARQTLSVEMKALAESMKPAEKKPEPLAKGAKAPAKPETKLPALDFAKFDVDGKLKSGIAELEKVAEEFPGTQAGFDAKMQLGSLYFDHGAAAETYEKSAKWFDRAASTAPSSEQTVFALYSLGYAQEALNRCGDAVKTFDRAVNTGSGSLQGELLRAKARCQETLGDKAAAKATYENIIKILPNSEAAKYAEVKKSTL